MLARPKVKALFFALAVVWLAGEALAWQSGPTPEAKQRYNQARRLLAQGEKEKAIEELKAVIQLSPQFVEAHRDFLDNQRDKAESFVPQYEELVKQNPNSAAYHYLLGKAYSNANKRDKADAEYAKSHELDPQFGWASFALISVATRAGNTDRALEHLENASKNAGDSTSLRAAIANTFMGKKKFDRAIEEANRVLEIDPEFYDALTTRWQSRLNLTLGADQTRAEVLGEIQKLESSHGKDITALLAVQSGYQMLEDEKGAERAKQAILAVDPKYFERQPFRMSMGTASGKIVSIEGANGRLLSETFRMKDDRQKLEAYAKLEKGVEDADAKLYVIYPAMLRSYIALKDIANAERVADLIIKGNAEPQEVAGHRVALARALYESKAKSDVALEHVRLAIEQLRKPLPKKEDAELSEYQIENAKQQLADALHLQGQLLLEKAMTEQAVASLAESVKIQEKEESLFDLGRAYVKAGKQDEAVETLSKAYAYEGKRQQESRMSLQKIYGSRAKSQPLDKLLSEALTRHRDRVRSESIARAVREITKTEAKDAPAFSLATLSGQQVSLADLRGKIVLLNFWATW